jgi:hypothetical protein
MVGFIELGGIAAIGVPGRSRKAIFAKQDDVTRETTFQFIALIAATILLVLTGGCGKSSSSGTSNNFVGSYSGTFELDAVFDEDYEEVGTFSITVAEDGTISGTYELKPIDKVTLEVLQITFGDGSETGEVSDLTFGNGSVGDTGLFTRGGKDGEFDLGVKGSANFWKGAFERPMWHMIDSVNPWTEPHTPSVSGVWSIVRLQAGRVPAAVATESGTFTGTQD